MTPDDPLSSVTRYIVASRTNKPRAQSLIRPSHCKSFLTRHPNHNSRASALVNLSLSLSGQCVPCEALPADAFAKLYFHRVLYSAIVCRLLYATGCTRVTGDRAWRVRERAGRRCVCHTHPHRSTEIHHMRCARRPRRTGSSLYFPSLSIYPLVRWVAVR